MDFEYIAGQCGEGEDGDPFGGVFGEFEFGQGGGGSEGSCGLFLGGGSNCALHLFHGCTGNLILGGGSEYSYEGFGGETEDFSYVAGQCDDGDLDTLGDGLDLILGGGFGGGDCDQSLILGGESEYSFEEAGGGDTEDFEYVAGGNLILGGGSNCALHLFHGCVGDLELGAACGLRVGYVCSSVGNLELGAACGLRVGYVCSSVGNLELGDACGLRVGYVCSSVGNLELGAACGLRVGYVGGCTGNLELGDACGLRVGYVCSSVGNLELGDGVIVRVGLRYTPEDNLALGDESDCNLHLHCTSTGNLELGESALLRASYRDTTDGELVLGGESEYNTDSEGSVSYVTSGTLILGSSSLAFAAYPNHYHTATGNLDLGGQSITKLKLRSTSSGRFLLSSSASVISPAYSWVPSGKLLLGGQNVISAHLIGPVSGELELEGNSPSTMHLYATMEGGLTLGSNIFESTKESYSYFIDLDSSWYVIGKIESDLDSSWDVGNQAFHYYQVQGKCKTPPDCETTNLSVDDAKCSSGGGRFLQTVVARNLSDVCAQLKKIFLTFPSRWPIESIKRFSRPVYLEDIAAETAQGIDHDCNVLGATSFCHIPECLEFCAGEPLLVEIGLETSIQDRFFDYESSGIVVLSGLVLGNEDQGTTPEGELDLGGTAQVACSHYSYTWSNGFILSGDPEVTCSAWNYTPDSNVEIYGMAPSVSSAYRYTPTGKLYVEGQNTAKLKLGFNPYYPLLKLKGVAQERVTRKYGLMDGLVMLGSTATSKSSHYTHTPIGQLDLGSTAATISSQWSYETGTGFTVGGSSKIGRRHYPEGGLALAGGADTGQIIQYLPTGSLLMGGEIVVNASSGWSWANTSGVTLAGDVDTNCLNLGTLDVEGTSLAELVDLQQVYQAVDDIDTVEFVADTGEVTVNSGCDPISIQLLFSHNLDQSAVLKEFLKRNKLELPKNLTLTYNKFDNAWRNNIHFQGSNQDSNENWLVLFEWACGDEVGSKLLDFNVWKFSILVVRFFRTTEGIEKTETRILYTFPTSPVCKDQNIDFTFTINTQTGEVELPEVLAVSDTILTDEIGLFASSYWTKTPNLKFVISDRNLPQEPKIKTIKSDTLVEI